MKNVIAVIALMLISIGVSAQSGVEDSIALKTLIKNEEAAWNKHDWKDFTTGFTEDGTLINFIGSYWKTRNDILAHLTQFHDALKTTSLTFNIAHIRPLSPEISIVYVKQIIVVTEDNQGPLQKNLKGDKEYKMIAFVCIKKAKVWKIASMQVSPIDQRIFHELENEL